MSEAAEAETASTDGQQLAGMLPAVESLNEGDEPQEPQTPEPKKNGAYQERVDLSGLPDDIRAPIEARFAHLSRLMKKNEIRSNSELSQWKELAAEQSRAIEELRNGVGQVVDHLQGESIKDAELRIRSEMRAAHESGDTEAFISANDKLAELKAKKIALDQQKKTVKPEKREPAEQRFASGNEIAQDALASGEITEDDVVAVKAWIGESDDVGNPLRPWAFSRNQNNPTADPIYRRALIEMAAVFDEASPFANKPMDEKLAEVDRRMGLTRTKATQSVMGGQLTIPRKSSKLTLSPQQEKIALKTQFGGPKAKSDAEHIEAFRKQLEKVRGARK